jgi:hypothetical protein
MVERPLNATETLGLNRNASGGRPAVAGSQLIEAHL